MSRLAACLLLASLCGGAEGLPTGQIIDRVICSADAAQSYALYLPSSFQPDHTWPVLYAFDPRARGRLPVERFQAAAEKYGYIVAGSNNSRNGSFEASVAAMNAMLKDVEARFPVNPNRRYATGFSGGARVASWMAIRSGALAGVMLAGGGFPQANVESVPFAVYGIAGTEDFNWSEMYDLELRLRRLGAYNRRATFEGTHAWPPPEFCARAIEWFELHAMRTQRLARSEQLVGALLTQRRDALAGLPLALRWKALTELVEDFRTLCPLDEFEREAAKLGSLAEIKRYQKEQRQEYDRSTQVALETGSIFRYPPDAQEQRQALDEARTSIARVRSRAEGKQESMERRVARRALAGWFAAAYEEGRAELDKRGLDRALFLFSLAVELSPRSYGGWFELARVRARLGTEQAALDALRKAVAAGFTDRARLEQDAAFERLRGKPAFAEILTAIPAAPGS